MKRRPHESRRNHLASSLERQRSSVEQATTLYATLATSVTLAEVPRVVTDEAGDDQVIAAAVAAKATLIISGDRHLLAPGTFQGIDFLSPAEALARIGGYGLGTPP